MSLKNLKNEYPEMPDEIRKMIEVEVNAQMKIENKEEDKKKSFSKKKFFAIGLVATMTLGTTVFAGATMHKLYMEKEGEYGLKAGLTSEGEALPTMPNEI